MNNGRSNKAPENNLTKGVCPYERVLDYNNYLNNKRYSSSQRSLFSYKGVKIPLTKRQFQVVRLIAKGFSNSKIANILETKETTIKLLIYRLMKYLELVLYQDIDRYSLIIIAQELVLGGR